MNKLKSRFTKWYIKRGYTFGYNFANTAIYSDGFLSTPWGMPKAIFTCPWWVKPLLVFFSPSVYSAETFGKVIAKALEEGILMGIGAENHDKGDKNDEHD